MIFPFVPCLAATLYASSVVAKHCTSNLVIDDFNFFAARLNKFGLKVGDDNTMKTLTADHNTLSFVPSKTSYFFETLPCFDAASAGYGALSFRLKAPLGSSFALELQTKEDCYTSEYKSTWHYMEGFTGKSQNVVIPLDAFTGANTYAIQAFNWAAWNFYNDKSFIWTLTDIELMCNVADHPRVAGNNTAEVV